MLYNAPNWTNDSAPAINAENLQAISDTLEQDGNEIQTLQTQQANPFNYKGVVANVASLPSSGNTINDTYYVTAATCLYSWNGSAWSVSSMSEVDYMATLQNIMDDIAEEYDATSAYAVGDYCIYNEKLYKCNTAITTAEAWTSGHWTRVSVTQGLGDDITYLKSALKVLGASSFTKASGNSHSSTIDKAVGLSIASGEKFCIMYTRPSTNWTYFYGYDSNGTQYSNPILSTNLSEGINIITAPGDIASIGWADSSTTTSGIYKFSVVAYDSVFSEANEALQLANYVVPVVDTYCYCKNIIGAKPGVLYPCEVENGTPLTVSTADGNNITTNNTYINFYDEKRTYIKQFNFYNGYSSRSFTYDGSATAKYVAFTGNQFPLQLERGSTKTTYQPYFSNAKDLTQIIDDGYFNYDLGVNDVLGGTLINGIPSSNTSRIYSREFNVMSGDYISFNNVDNAKLQYTVVTYNADGSYNTQTSWRTSAYTFSSDSKIRLLIGMSDYSEIPAADYGAVAKTVTLHLSEENQFRQLMGSPNYVPIVSDPDHDTKTQEFAAKYNGVGNASSFIFFSDPHILSSGGKSAFYNKLYKYTGLIGEYFDKLSTAFVLCGGDWLEWTDTPAVALWKLNLMQGRVRELFGERYYPAFGNHDNNYQGTEEAGVKTLSRQIIRDVMFPYWDNTYYTFKMPEARFYVLDTGTDWNQAMDVDDRWAQIAWLAEQLAENDDPHSAICMHILWNASDSTSIATFANNVQALVGAYNSHTTITLNSVTYNFTGCVGKVGFIIGGHLHADKSDTTNYSVPIIATINTQAGGGSFDLVIADWTDGKLYMVRVGSGDNRTFNIVI